MASTANTLVPGRPLVAWYTKVSRSLSPRKSSGRRTVSVAVPLLLPQVTPRASSTNGAGPPYDRALAGNVTRLRYAVQSPAGVHSGGAAQAGNAAKPAPTRATVARTRERDFMPVDLLAGA